MAMKNRIASVILFSGVLAVAGFHAMNAQQATTLKKVPVRPLQSVKGQDLFREYCAVCHGTDGKGSGPAAGALKIPASDLTQIARKNGGKFPEITVEHMITGEADGPVAHGSKDMPVWGNLFRHMGPNENLASNRVFNLMKYIEGIQEK